MAKQSLHAKFIESVETTKIQEDFWDSKLKGFGIRVSINGRKTWFVFYRYGGQKRRMNLGTYPAISLHDARKTALEVLRRVYMGHDPVGDVNRSVTFRQLADKYLTEHAKVHKLSWKEDERCLNKDILPYFVEMPILQIKKQHVIECLQKIAQRDVPIQVNRNFGRLRKIFNFAVELDLLEHSPCSGLKKPFKEKSRDRVLSADELKKIFDQLPKLSCASRNLLAMLTLSAQRSKEVKLMRWEDMDLKNKVWVIPSEFAKNGRTHTVPLTDSMIEIIAEQSKWRFVSRWVFPSRSDNTKHVQNHQKALKRLSILASVDFRGHDLRRTAATTMGRLGVNRLVISKLLNHVESSVTSVYDRHAYDTEKRIALEHWERFLLSIRDVVLDSSQSIQNFSGC